MKAPHNTAEALDLFDSEPRYPLAPGHKRQFTGTTSKEAAQRVAVHARNLRGRVLEQYSKAGPLGLTADECAVALGCSILSVRPRTSELAAMGFLVPSGDRRRNDSGHAAAVLRVTDAGLREAGKAVR
jgi:hypothetical protein